MRYINDKLFTFDHVQYYSDKKKDPHYLERNSNSDEEDSMFGSFNPNLRTKDGGSGKSSHPYD
jgi:hypothetical protein